MNDKRAEFLAGLLFLCSAFAVTDKARGQTAGEAEVRGKEIYLHGRGTAGTPIVALVGASGVEAPASVLTCANCHGPDGRGRPEGGIYPSNLRWGELTKPYPVVTRSGRERLPYTEQLVIRAVTMGIDSGGNRLDPTMPKYELTRQQAADLVAYLKLLDHELDPGITDKEIKIGVVLPDEENFGGMQRAVRETLTAAFQKLNDGGGIYGRRIVCEFTTVSGRDRVESFRQIIRQEQPFALVESFIAGDEGDICALVEQERVPVVGAITLFPTMPAGRFVFYLDSGIPGQGEALARFACGHEGIKAARALIVCSDRGDRLETAVNRISRQAEAAGWPSPQSIHPAEDQNWAGILQATQADVVFWLAPGEGLARFFSGALASQQFPFVLAPGALVGREICQAPEQFSNRLFLSFPVLPSDQTTNSRQEFLQLAAAGKFSAGDLAARLSALSAAKLLVYGLQKAGRELTREKLIDTLEGLYRFETGQMPPLTFTPNRRVGTDGVHVLAVDRNRLILPGTWVELPSP